MGGVEQVVLHDLHVGGVRHREVDDHSRPALRLVADPQDLAVAHEPEGAIQITNLGDADADLLDDTGRRSEIDDVTDAELILDHHEQTVENVFDDVLRPEAQACSERSGEQSERPEDVRVDGGQDEQQGYDDDDDRHDVAEHAPERACALNDAHRRERR